MKTHPILLIIALNLLFQTSCVMNPINEGHENIVLKPATSKTPLKIEVTTGTHYSQKMQAGPFIFVILPQIVFWIESTNGTFLQTLYVTGADGKQLRHADKSKRKELFYQECFPFWAKKMKEVGAPLPGSTPYPDSVTSATPHANFSLSTAIDLNSSSPLKSFVIFAEINKSSDINQNFTKLNNGWAGQPAVLYKTVINKIETNSNYTMQLIGHSGKISDRPDIYVDMGKLDSALRLIKKIEISFRQ